MKRKQVTADDLYNLWLEPYHGVTVQWLVDNEPELIKTPEWYKKYAVTQEQHDQWYEKAIDLLCKEKGAKSKKSREFVKKNFCFDYLNISPSVYDTKT